MTNQEIKAKIDSFVRDPNLEKVMSWQMTFNIFEISGLGETQHSSIIAWLLDPNESHNLGSRFIKSLLRAAKFKFEDCKKDSKCQKRAFMNNSFLSDWSYYDIEISSFQHVQVVTEFKAGKRIKSGYDAVDICVLDQNNSLLIVIENKYGSRDYRKLPNYYEYLQDNFRDLKYKLYICLDAYVPLKNIDDNWIGLSYDWIEYFCEEAIEKETLTPKVEMILTDYLECIGDEIHTKCHKDLEGILATLSHNHKELLDLLDTEKITTPEGDKKIRDLYIEDLHNSNIGPSSIKYHLIRLYWKYYDIMEKLFQYNIFHLIKNEIEKSLPNTKLEFYSAPTYLYFMNEEWFGYMADKTDEWVIYPIYYRNRRTEDENTIMEHTIQCEIYKPNINDDYLGIFERIAERLDIELREKYTTFALDKTARDYKSIANEMVIRFKKIEQLLTRFSSLA